MLRKSQSIYLGRRDAEGSYWECGSFKYVNTIHHYFATSLHALANLWTREGTVDYALRQSDGQSVSLDSVIVAKVSDNLLFVRDPWPNSPVYPCQPGSAEGVAGLAVNDLNEFSEYHYLRRG